jgi:hypothetical protein
MATNPLQPALLAVPWTLLYGLCDATAAGAVTGGFGFAVAKLFVRRLASRMSTPHGRGFMYSTVADCLVRSTRQFGVYSWFAGLCATSLTSITWHGLALQRLCDRRTQPRGGFADDVITASAVHGGLTLLTTPLRNMFRSGLADVERSGGVKTISEFLSGERAVFLEAAGVATHALRHQHFRFFLEGGIRTLFKTSVPFGVTFAMFRSFGGDLPSRHGNVGVFRQR